MSAKRSIIPAFVPHLGCPYKCVFCNQNRISGEEKPATAADVERIVSGALKVLPAGGVKTVAFYGGSFTAIPACEQEELLGAAKRFIDAGLVSDIRLSTRPDAVDEETVERLLRYGVRTVELGIQSMDPEVLRLSARGHTARDAERAAGLIKAAGLELILQMMTGLPGDTPEKSEFTARELIGLCPDGVRIYPTVIVRDTPLEKMWRAGLYREHTVEEAARLCARLLDLFDEAGIPVIRLGLNPTEDLSGGDAVGGAYHPALRELAEAERYLARERMLLSESDRGKTVILTVGEGMTSRAVGQHRKNAAALSGEFGLRRVIFREAPLKPLEVVREKTCN